MGTLQVSGESNPSGREPVAGYFRLSMYVNSARRKLPKAIRIIIVWKVSIGIPPFRRAPSPQGVLYKPIIPKVTYSGGFFYLLEVCIMATPADRIEQELRRKARLGIQPSDSNNMQRYNEIRAQLNQSQPKTTQNETVRTVSQPKTGMSSIQSRPTPQSRFDDIYNQIGSIRNQLTREATSFSYDPKDDPQSQAALRQAQRNAQTAAGDIAAEMNRRGLLNSTITQDRSDQAAQREYARVSDTLLPQLMQQAYNRYLNEQNARRQAIMDQLGLTEAQYGMFTGERAYADTRADLDYDRRQSERQANWAAYLDTVDRSGTFGTGPKSNWGLLLEGVNSGAPTLANQQFQFQQEESEADRAFREQQAALEQQYRNAQLALSRDDNARQWAQFNWQREQAQRELEQAANQSPSTGSLTANQFLDAIQNQYLEPVMDGAVDTGQTRITTDPARREQMFWQVVDAGYDNSTTDQILRALGFTADEINRYAGQ